VRVVGAIEEAWPLVPLHSVGGVRHARVRHRDNRPGRTGTRVSVRLVIARSGRAMVPAWRRHPALPYV